MCIHYVKVCMLSFSCVDVASSLISLNFSTQKHETFCEGLNGVVAFTVNGQNFSLFTANG